jgi:rifampicin phosphotransferase
VPIDRELRQIVWLHEAGARDAQLTGAKAANLARAAAAGLPVLPGFVITTAATSGGILPEGLLPALRDAVDRLPKAGPGQCVVRSSSTVEDSTTSSMAGQFTSLLGVAGTDALVDAVRTVLGSSLRPRDERTSAKPMAPARDGVRWCPVRSRSGHRRHPPPGRRSGGGDA